MRLFWLLPVKNRANLWCPILRINSCWPLIWAFICTIYDWSVQCAWFNYTIIIRIKDHFFKRLDACCCVELTGIDLFKVFYSKKFVLLYRKFTGFDPKNRKNVMPWNLQTFPENLQLSLNRRKRNLKASLSSTSSIFNPFLWSRAGLYRQALI